MWLTLQDPDPHSVPGYTEYARRSTDSLPLIRKKEESHSQLHESISSAKEELRQVRSEHGSPEPRAPRFRENIGGLPPLDLQYPSYNGNGQYSEEYSQSPSGLENYYTSQEEPPAMSAGLSMPAVDWNDIDLTSGAFSAAYSQPPSYASFEHSNMSRPALTTSSSGEVSEVDDYINHGQGTLLRPDPASTSAEDVSYNRLSSSSFTSLPQPSTLSSRNLDSLDYETFLHTTASPSEFEEPTVGGSGALYGMDSRCTMRKRWPIQKHLQKRWVGFPCRHARIAQNTCGHITTRAKRVHSCQQRSRMTGINDIGGLAGGLQHRVIRIGNTTFTWRQYCWFLCIDFGGFPSASAFMCDFSAYRKKICYRSKCRASISRC